MTDIKKHFTYKTILVLLSLSVNTMLKGQEVDPSELLDKKNRMYHLGKEAQRTGNHYLALHYFEEVYRKDSTDLDLVLELANLYRLTHNYPKTEQYFTKIVKSKKLNKHPEALFYLGQAQKNLEKYAEAKVNLLKFKKNMKTVGDQRLKKLYKTELEGCEMMLNSKKDSTQVVVRNAGAKLNHPHIDFSPIPLGETQMIYGSYPDKAERIYKLDENGEVKTPKRIFLEGNKEKGEWKSTGPYFDDFFSDTTMDIANGCFSLDSNRFYFTKCSPNWQYKMICVIYESKRTKNGGWTEPKPLNELVNLEGYTSTHPTVGRESKKNKEVLYFVSDREGSRGGMDIWFSEWDSRKKTFKKPRNAGAKVNSAGNEMTPFYDLPTKTLYFSSDGRANVGGMDIFFAVGETNSWQEAQNIGTGINSSADDLDYVLRPSNRGGYFVSNRIGGLSLYHPTCCDDIYEFEFSKYIDILAMVKVKDPNGNEVKNDLTLNLYVVDDSSKLLVKVNTAEMREFNLRPNQRYVIEAKKPGHYTASTEFTTAGIIENTKIEKEMKLREHEKLPIVIPNINFEFDSPLITASSKITIDTTLLELFKRQPNIKIEISAHTDSKGSDVYNLNLSQKRAESIVKYLASKGVPLDQMIPKGYGETKPIAPNQNSDGSDNPEGRRQNRRVEFTVLGEVEMEF